MVNVKLIELTPDVNVTIIKQIVNGWNKLIDTGSGNPWWEKQTVVGYKKKIDRFESTFKTYLIIVNNFAVGEVNYNIIDNIVELGYWLNPDYWSNGYAFEAVKQLLMKLNKLGHTIFYFETRETNLRSIKLLERVGAKYVLDSYRVRLNKKWKYVKYQIGG